MSRFSSFTRRAQVAASVLSVSAMITACQDDQIAGVPVTCDATVGCDPILPVAVPEALAAIADISTRLVVTLDAASRTALVTPLSRFQRGVEQRDVAAGQAALQSIYAIVALAEQMHPEDMPDLSALRLELVPGAVSLGLTPVVSSNPTR